MEKASEKGGAEGGKGPRTNGFMTLKVPSTAPIPMAACRPSRAGSISNMITIVSRSSFSGSVSQFAPAGGRRKL